MSNAASRLTPSQREEIARGHDRERPRELARRLGLPRLAVEEEVRRIRGADAVSMRRPWNLLALSMRIGGLLLFAAVVLGITELGCTTEQLESEPLSVQERFRRHLQERAR